jgi:hypothetical protein
MGRSWIDTVRALVFFLVFANLLFYAFSQGFFGQIESADAHRLRQQLAPEKVKIIAQGASSAAQAETPADPPAESATTPEVTPPPVAEPPPERVAEPAAKVAEITCSRWSALSAKDAERLATLIGKRFPDVKLSRLPEAMDANGWWVFIPPSLDKAAADQKAAQLRAFGVSDYFIVQDPSANRFAISLGIFSSEKGAQERLADLKEKGVRSARISLRPAHQETVTLSASAPEGERSALRLAVAGWLPKARAQDCK